MLMHVQLRMRNIQVYKAGVKYSGVEITYDEDNLNFL